MVPTPLGSTTRSTRLLYPFASLIVNNAPKVVRIFAGGSDAAIFDEGHVHNLHKRKTEVHGGKLIAFGILIPILVLLSGLFAGLTLGYMSLDETQLHVLSISGTPKQKEYARKIQPIRKNGHLLLITLILANMIVNETLPVIADPVFDSELVSVIASTALIVVFSEIIPQSLCTRYGLAIGAHMAWLVKILILVLGIISWPVAKFLEFILGSQHGIMYRRAELKELIALHATTGQLGGDLKSDTVTIIGATLDLQEKVVRQAMTPMEKVFMLSIDSVLDQTTMKEISDTGHSRVPIYEEVEVPIVSGPEPQVQSNTSVDTPETLPMKTRRVKKIAGILLVKQCLMLDPKEATPLRSLRLHKVFCIPNNAPLLEVLDRFQEGRSHMAIVGRFSYDKAASVKAEVKQSLTHRLKERVGIHDSSSESSSDGSDSGGGSADNDDDQDATLREDKKKRCSRRKKNKRKSDIEKGDVEQDVVEPSHQDKSESYKVQTRQITWSKVTSVGREQSFPDDAVLNKDGVDEFLQSFDPAVMPLGILTLEDVLEELIGEEIYDEFDEEGHSRLKHYVAPSKRKGTRQDSNHNASSLAVGLDGNPTLAAGSTRPLSPALSDEASSGEYLVAKGVSLGHSLTALVSHKKKRGATEPNLESKPGSRRGNARRSSAPAPGSSIVVATTKSDADETNLQSG